MESNPRHRLSFVRKIHWVNHVKPWLFEGLQSQGLQSGTSRGVEELGDRTGPPQPKNLMGFGALSIREFEWL